MSNDIKAIKAELVTTTANTFAAGVDVWPNLFRKACEIAMSGDFNDTDRNKGKTSKDGKRLPSLDDASDLLDDIRTAVNRLGKPGVNLSEETATSRKSNIRGAIRLGMLKPAKNINGVALIADVDREWTKINDAKGKKQLFDCYTSVASAQIKAPDKRLTVDQIVPLVVAKKPDPKGLAKIWAIAVAAIEKTQLGDDADADKARVALLASMKQQVTILAAKEKADAAKEAADAANAELAKATNGDAKPEKKAPVKAAAAVVGFQKKKSSKSK